VARTIIKEARRQQVDSLQEQLDYTLRLVCWSWIARECGVQLRLIDALLDAGASPDGRHVYEGRFGTHSDAAIYNGNFAAAEHLIDRGAPLTLSTALCLGRWTDAEPLARAAPLQDRQNAFVQAALSGNAEALRRMLALGMAPTTVSRQNQSHGTALHHAVWSGSLDAVRVLVEAGADLTRRDTIYNGTPLGWAEHGEQSQKEGSPAKPYAAIAVYLRERGGT
jgi:peptide-methionine (S)-S-oxide reductase